jgi:hypothetical protein
MTTKQVEDYAGGADVNYSAMFMIIAMLLMLITLMRVKIML